MNILKKWWFWIIIIVLVITVVLIIQARMQKEQEEAIKNIGSSASEYIKGIDTSQSHINDFSYNYETGKVEYRPSIITLEMYNRIENKMTESDVVSILGNYDNKKNGENSIMLSWGNMNMSKGYWIQIVLDKEGKVSSKNQIGLK